MASTYLTLKKADELRDLPRSVRLYAVITSCTEPQQSKGSGESGG